MVWQLHDLIHLYLTDVRQSEFKTTQTPLSLCDNLMAKNEWELLFTFKPLTQEVFDAFNEIVRSDSRYTTTVSQVMDFVKFCEVNLSKYAFPLLAGISKAEISKLKLPKDLLVVIEFED